MKTKNILMSLLLVMGAIAAKASGYPPELALVSQPVMVYNYSSITVYYDVQNIGDYTYKGYVSLYLYPDDGRTYADKYVKVYPGKIKRISLEIPAYRFDKGIAFTIMPYYEMDDELFSFTTFEYFEPLTFFWNGPRNEHWVVISIPPRVRHYNRPGSYRYYYDGFRPPMPPPGDHRAHGTPPPMDPMHHTYSYHHNNGGYPAHHFNEGTPPPAPHNNNVAPPAPHNNNVAPSATVRPKPDGGSMSSGHYNSGTAAPATPKPNNSMSESRPKVDSNASSGRTGNSSTSCPSVNSNTSSSSSSARPANSGSNSGRTGNSDSRPKVNSGSGSSNSVGSSTRGSSSSSGASTRGTSTNSSTRSSSSSAGASTRSSNASGSRSGSSSVRK